MPPAKVPSDKELKLAKSLVDQLTERFDPEKHPDEYRARVAALVEEKIEKGQTKDVDDHARGKARGGNVIDLSELLAKSLKAKPGPAKAPRGAKTGRAPDARRAHGHAHGRRAAG